MGGGAHGEHPKLPLGEVGLPVSRLLFIRSRRWPTTVSACVVFELALPLAGGEPLRVWHGPSFTEGVPNHLILQIVPVMLLLYALDSEHHLLERGAARSLIVPRIAATVGGGLIVALAALVPSFAYPIRHTLHPLASVAALVGMYGIGSIAACFIDRRLAGLVAYIPVLAPLTFDPTRIPGHSWWSFVIPGDQSRDLTPAWLFWGCAGVALFSVLASRAPLLGARET